MITKIAKDFYWEMSHRLPFHKGPCRNIHGHSYKIRVEISGDADKNGIVMDYYDLKLLIMPITEKLDHAFVVDSDDMLMINFLKENDMKHYILDKTTTAEHLAEFLFEEVKSKIKNNYSNISYLTIRLFETDDVYAEVGGEISLLTIY